MYQLPEEKLQPGMTLAQPGQTAVQEPPAAPLNDPTAFKMQPGPVGAKYLTEPAPTAEPVAPQAAAPQDDYWTKERKDFYKRVYDTASQYGKLVQTRRQKRSATKEYDKLKNQLEKEASMYSDLKEMQASYGPLFGVDANGEPNKHAIAIQRQQAKHLQAATRLRDELRKKAQQLNKQFKIPLDKNGDLIPDWEAGDDQQFDQAVMRGGVDGFAYGPPQ